MLWVIQRSAPGVQQRLRLCGHLPTQRAGQATGMSVRTVDVDHAAQQGFRPVDHLGDSGGSAVDHGGQDVGEVRVRGRIDPLNEHVEFAAARQAYGEGVVVGVAEPGSSCRTTVLQQVQAQLVDGALDTAPGDAADRIAVGVDRQGGAERKRRTSPDTDDRGQSEGVGSAGPAVQGFRDVQHALVLHEQWMGRWWSVHRELRRESTADMTIAFGSAVLPGVLHHRQSP